MEPGESSPTQLDDSGEVLEEDGVVERVKGCRQIEKEEEGKFTFVTVTQDAICDLDKSCFSTVAGVGT